MLYFLALLPMNNLCYFSEISVNILFYFYNFLEIFSSEFKLSIRTFIFIFRECYVLWNLV